MKKLLLFLLLFGFFVAPVPVARAAVAPVSHQEQATTNQNDSNSPTSDAARRVKVNFYLNSISQIDDQTNSYIVDLWLDLFWYDETIEGKGMDEVDTSTLWTPKLEFVNASNSNILYESFSDSVEIDTNVHFSQRLRATFSNRFDLRRFPFDQQTLLLTIESKEYDSNQLLFDFVIFDEPPAHSEEALIQPIALEKYFGNETNLEGWTLSNGQVVQQIRVLSYDKSSWSQLRIEIQADRIATPYLRKIVLILLFLLIFAWGVFWVGMHEIRYRLLVLSTLLLATATLDYKLVQILPLTVYMTMMDHYIALCYILLTAVLLVILLTKALSLRKQERLAVTLNHYALLGYPALVVIANLGLLLFALW